MMQGDAVVVVVVKTSFCDCVLRWCSWLSCSPVRTKRPPLFWNVCESVVIRILESWRGKQLLAGHLVRSAWRVVHPVEAATAADSVTPVLTAGIYLRPSRFVLLFCV